MTKDRISSLIREIERFSSEAEYRPGFMELLPGVQPSEPKATEPLRVAFILLPGFTLTAFAGFIDALRLASDIGDRSLPRYANWTLLNHNRDPITSSCGIAVSPKATLQDASDFDCLVVVGGVIRGGETCDKRTLDFISRAHSRGLQIVGLCTGVFALAEAGVLDGRRACVHGYHIQGFHERFPDINMIANQLFVQDGDILTCAGGTAVIDAAGHFLEGAFGKIRAHKILPHLLVDELRRAEHPQISFMKDFFEVHDERVRLAVFLMQININTPITITLIARTIGVQPRQLERAFRKELGLSPSQFYRRMRVGRARWYLLHTSWTVTTIAFDCGFADTSHLTRSFKAEFGMLPSKMRQATKHQAGFGPSVS